MATETFGSLLRQYRNRTNDPHTGRTLSLMRFVDMLAELTEGQLSYSHAALQNWETDKSHINSLERNLLVALIRVLVVCGGIQKQEEADALLQSGGYLALSSAELEQINSQWVGEEQPTQQGTLNLPYLFMLGMADWLQHPHPRLRMLYFISDDLPPDSGDRVMIALRWFRNRFSAERVTFLICLIILTLLVREMCFRLLSWPLEVSDLNVAIAVYSTGIIVIPLLIAVLAWWRQRQQWQLLSQPVAGGQRYAFTLVGSVTGFNVALGIVCSLFLFFNDFWNRSMNDLSAWIQLGCALGIVLVAYLSARQMPREVWTAFRGLRFTIGDAAILTLFLLIDLSIGGAIYLTYPLFLETRLAGTVLIVTLAFVAAIVVGGQRHRDVQAPLSFTGWLVLFAVPWVLFALVQPELEQTVVIVGSAFTVILISFVVERIRGR